MSTWAMIENGNVVNTIVIGSDTPQDPAYTWVELTYFYCVDGMSPIQIGCTYDGANFYPASS